MYRSLFDRQPSDTLVERPPMSTDILTLTSLVVYWSTIDQLPAYLSVKSVLYHLIVERELTARLKASVSECHSIPSRYPPSAFDQYSMDTPLKPWLTLDCRTIDISGSNFRIPVHSIYMCRCALKNEEYDNSCYSYSVRC